MDVVQQFSNETLGLLIQKMNQRNEQVLDIVQTSYDECRRW